MRVSTIDDCLKLQTDFDSFSIWSSPLGLLLNPSECQVFTFGKIKSPFKFPYSLGENNIPRVSDYVTDLGFKLSCYLDPSYHINYVCCKAFKSLGFVMRLSKDFQFDISIKTLYCALVRPILEYGSVVWDPHTANDSRHLERVQHRFLRFACRILHIPCHSHDYSPVANVLGLSSLAERRHTAGIRFIDGLLNGKVESSAILSLICFKVPQRSTRSTTPFYVPHSTTNYIANEPLRRLMSNANADTNFTFC
ncbi:uncharacterized protein LOC112592916 [Melanaphis sacchari]|uniref:uncharacterized protein LOC112592916 n=1 Tax=Melanaphis sacchari TaxID=742174 RepID=UPI000DC150CD|nr:uncharacterized protein LOC112592916 [Melanaphis sacchari]